jgi:hypothetical protein
VFRSKSTQQTNFYLRVKKGSRYTQQQQQQQKRKKEKKIQSSKKFLISFDVAWYVELSTATNKFKILSLFHRERARYLRYFSY